MSAKTISNGKPSGTFLSNDDVASYTDTNARSYSLASDDTSFYVGSVGYVAVKRSVVTSTSTSRKQKKVEKLNSLLSKLAK